MQVFGSLKIRHRAHQWELGGSIIVWGWGTFWWFWSGASAVMNIPNC